MVGTLDNNTDIRKQGNEKKGGGMEVLNKDICK